MAITSLLTNKLLPVYVPVKKSAVISGTTGSPSTTTFTGNGTTTGEDGVSYTAYRWTGLGSVTISTAGYADVFVLGGGGGGGDGNGSGYGAAGGGGGIFAQRIWIPAATYTVTIGGGGAAGTGTGGDSSVGSLAVGYGATGGWYFSNAPWYVPGGVRPYGGVGGNHGASGGSAAGLGGGSRGAATTTYLYGAAGASYGLGGVSHNNATRNEAANTGNGATGGTDGYPSGQGAGGSGIVIIKVETP